MGSLTVAPPVAASCAALSLDQRLAMAPVVAYGRVPHVARVPMPSPVRVWIPVIAAVVAVGALAAVNSAFDAAPRRDV